MVMKDYRAHLKDAHEISINVNGNNFLCIYQCHVSGYMLSIPNWGICIEMSKIQEQADIDFNAYTLSKALKVDNAEEVAKEILIDLYSYLVDKKYIEEV